MRLAQAYINLDMYKEAAASLKTALDKGGLKRKDQAYVMLGMSEFELQRFDSSIKAFQKAAKDKRSRKSAESWLTYVSSEKTRKQQLEASLKRRSRR